MQTNSRITAVAIDFGGTIDSDGLNWIRRFHGLFSESGAVVDLDVFYRFIRSVDAQLLLQPDIGNCTLRDLIIRHVDCQLAGIQELHLPKGLPHGFREHAISRFTFECEAALLRNAAVLQSLSKLAPLAVLSNFYGCLSRILADYDLYKYFVTVVDSAVVGCRKPDPRIFRILSNRLGVTPAATLYCGDSLAVDIRPAMRLGFSTVWLKHPNIQGEAEEVHSITCLGELVPIVEKRVR